MFTVTLSPFVIELVENREPYNRNRCNDERGEHDTQLLNDHVPSRIYLIDLRMGHEFLLNP
jgi:hypothetical protein